MIIALVTHYCEGLWPTYLNYVIQEIRCDGSLYYLGSLSSTTSKTFCNFTIGEHFLTIFCEMFRNCKRKVMFCNKVRKQCLRFNDLIIEGTVCTWQEWWNRLWLVLERNNFQVILSFSMSDYITFGRRSNVNMWVTKGAKCIPINIIYIRKKNSMGI